MNRFFSTGVVFMIGAACAVAFAQTRNTIVESARQIPLAGEADVVVVGGTTAGVAAALAAKEAGASVWLLAERPYLGDDMAGTLQLALPNDAEPQGPLAEALWTDRSAAGNRCGRLSPSRGAASRHIRAAYCRTCPCAFRKETGPVCPDHAL